MSEANMTGYQTARAISRHLGIAISNEDAVRLHNHIQSIAANAYTNGILNEREACLELSKSFAHNNTDLHDAIRARGVNT